MLSAELLTHEDGWGVSIRQARIASGIVQVYEHTLPEELRAAEAEAVRAGEQATKDGQRALRSLIVRAGVDRRALCADVAAQEEVIDSLQARVRDQDRDGEGFRTVTHERAARLLSATNAEAANGRILRNSLRDADLAYTQLQQDSRLRYVAGVTQVGELERDLATCRATIAQLEARLADVQADATEAAATDASAHWAQLEALRGTVTAERRGREVAVGALREEVERSEATAAELRVALEGSEAAHADFVNESALRFEMAQEHARQSVVTGKLRSAALDARLIANNAELKRRQKLLDEAVEALASERERCDETMASAETFRQEAAAEHTTAVAALQSQLAAAQQAAGAEVAQLEARLAPSHLLTACPSLTTLAHHESRITAHESCITHPRISRISRIMHHASRTTHHSSRITRHASRITRHASLIIHHSSRITRHRTTYHSSLITHHSSLITYQVARLKAEHAASEARVKQARAHMHIAESTYAHSREHICMDECIRAYPQPPRGE